MASLISRGRSLSGSSDTEITKYPIKRLEISIKNFTKVLAIALDRLQKHSVNIKRLTAAEDWTELHKEQVNATRTVQQITANIKEIEKVRRQVNNEDLHLFDSRVSELKTTAVSALDDFLTLLGGEASTEHARNQERRESFEFGTGDLQSVTENHLSSIPQHPPHPLSSSSSSQNSTTTTTTTSITLSQTENDTTTDANRHSVSENINDYNNATVAGGVYDINNTAADRVNNLPACDEDNAQSPLLLKTNLHVIPQHSEASASWQQLREDIEDLNEMVHVFGENVEQQGEVISNIEDNIDSAHAKVVDGTSFLAKASKYKAAMFPAIGAVLGGVVGGPIGFVAGLKIGGLAAVTGGAVGYAGGRYVKKRQEKIDEVEMTKMSYNNPVPDMKKDDHPPETNS